MLLGLRDRKTLRLCTARASYAPVKGLCHWPLYLERLLRNHVVAVFVLEKQGCEASSQVCGLPADGNMVCPRAPSLCNSFWDLTSIIFKPCEKPRQQPWPVDEEFSFASADPSPLLRGHALPWQRLAIEFSSETQLLASVGNTKLIISSTRWDYIINSTHERHWSLSYSSHLDVQLVARLKRHVQKPAWTRGHVLLIKWQLR